MQLVKGQNVRLAARLTGYKIDIRPESEVEFVDEDKKNSTENKESDAETANDEVEATVNHDTSTSDNTEE